MIVNIEMLICFVRIVLTKCRQKVLILVLWGYKTLFNQQDIDCCFYFHGYFFKAKYINK